MNRRLLVGRCITAALLLLALLLTPVNIFPCGTSSPEPVFTVRGSPDAPLSLFAQGRMGIVLPTYYRTYLVVAYRYLAGKPLSKEEETAFVQAWTPNFAHLSSGEAALSTWNKARSGAIPGSSYFPPSSEIDAYRVVQGGWHQYLNCADDAFLSAANTANNLIKTFGAGSPEVRDWVRAQDTVFDNCGPVVQLPVTPERASELRPRIPPAATIENAVLKQDRQYQIASANFYAGEFQTAAQQFQQIADERESPWRMWAPYLGMTPFLSGGALRNTKFGDIDEYRDNWWCGGQFPSTALPPGTVSYGNGPPIDPATGKQAVPVPVVSPPFPSFLTAAERVSADDQRSKLSALASGPVYMGRIVLEWAKAHPADERLPEALHLVVRATRYGCTDDQTGTISKQAFDLLHARYPDSTWARQTPYWFK